MSYHEPQTYDMSRFVGVWTGQEPMIEVWRSFLLQAAATAEVSGQHYCAQKLRDLHNEMYMYGKPVGRGDNGC